MQTPEFQTTISDYGTNQMRKEYLRSTKIEDGTMEVTQQISDMRFPEGGSQSCGTTL